MAIRGNKTLVHGINALIISQESHYAVHFARFNDNGSKGYSFKNAYLVLF